MNSKWLKRRPRSQLGNYKERNDMMAGPKGEKFVQK